jgi:DNA-binding HxlR family transcriptional regulator
MGSKLHSQWAPDARALSVVGDQWVLVIVRDLAAGPLRRNALGRLLPGVSAGALQERLGRMVEAGLIARHRESSLPPRVDLELTERGRALAGAIAELASWELRTQWSQPREDEWVDVAACFRLAPLLDCSSERPDGELELLVTDDEPAAYAFVRQGGRARIETRRAPDADARLGGTRAAWVRALSPRGTLADLTVDGEQRLAATFLDLFASPDARAR